MSQQIGLYPPRRDHALRPAVDDPARFRSSKRVGPWVVLTPSRNQSGERDV
ncbi:IS110 family transposase [Nioella ostreopsis]|uniref:IS110 family transposase n=1 Tax=Nioella ostreopsis TaxID=2448479 RepID=UPI001F0CADEE|nr:IS110 family transposase [Nioella ostreopsis]